MSSLAHAAVYTWEGGDYPVDEWGTAYYWENNWYYEPYYGTKWSGGLPEQFPQNTDTAIISSGRVFFNGNNILDDYLPVNIDIIVSGSGTVDLGEPYGSYYPLFFGVGDTRLSAFLPYTSTEASFTQSGGTVNNNVDGNGYGGYFPFMCLGAGDEGFATYTQTGGVLNSTSGITFGALGGEGTYEQSGGHLEMDTRRGAMVLGYGEPYPIQVEFPPGTGNWVDYEITGAGTGTWNISGNATANIAGNMILGKTNGATGELNMNGGKITFNPGLYYEGPFYEWDTPLIIAGYDGTGKINITAGTLEINDNPDNPREYYGDDNLPEKIVGGGLYLGLSNEGNSTGTVVQSGGKVVASYLVMGMGDAMTSTASYDISGGELSLRESIYLGSGTNNASNPKATMSVSGTAKVNVGGDILLGEDAYDPGALFLKDSGRPYPDSHAYVIPGELTISGGEINVGGQIATNAAGKGTVNILGSRAAINVGDYNIGTGDLVTSGTLDRGGLSTINAERNVHITAYTVDMPSGFHSLGTDTIVLAKAGSSLSGSGDPLVNNTVYDFQNTSDSNTLKYTIASADYEWDLMAETTFSETGELKGTLRVEGVGTDLLARFVGLDSNDSGMVDALVAYLNSATLDSGAKFHATSDGDIILSAGYLGAEGYAYFAWDLSGFNGGAITLQGFDEIPEPATWLMLLLGAAGVLWLRKRG